MLANIPVQLTHKQNQPNPARICRSPTTQILPTWMLFVRVGGFCLNVVSIWHTLLA